MTASIRSLTVPMVLSIVDARALHRHMGDAVASSQSRKAKSSAAVVPKVARGARVFPSSQALARRPAPSAYAHPARRPARSAAGPASSGSVAGARRSLVARRRSACSTATMRGADRSHVRLFADLRYQIQPMFPGIGRAATIDDFHDAWVRRRTMAIIIRRLVLLFAGWGYLPLGVNITPERV
jgi:hypothetical protein